MAKRRILIGYNGTPQGEDALVLGRALCQALDAIAEVVVVVHYPRHGPEGEKLEDSLDEFCEPLFAAARERLDGVSMRERPVVGSPSARVLHDLAEELEPTLMVIGSAHHGTLGQVLLGGVGESLLSGAGCGIAVAPLGYAESGNGLSRIGAAVDGSAQSLRALQAAALLAERTEAPLRVMTVEEPHHYALGGALSPYDPEEYERFKDQEAENVLDNALERVSSDLATERTLLEGAPAGAIAEAARDLDLLLVGSRGYGPLKAALLGSVSSKLMRSAPLPVLVLPRGSGTDPLEA